MGEVYEKLFTPFMNRLEMMNIPGVIAPIAVLTLVWGLTALKHFIQGKATSRDWFGTILYCVAVLLGIWATVQGQS